MKKISLASKLMLILSLIIVIALFFLGHSLAPQIKELGMSQYIQQNRWQGGLFVFSFVFAFPVGLLLIVLAGLMNGKLSGKYLFLAIHVVILGALLVMLWPFIAGRENSVSYFGFSGGLLLVLIFSVGWFWSQLRANCQPEHRKIVDLRGASYFFFALATWNMCGVGGMPGYALYPERSIEVNAYPFIIGQVKVVMLYLVLAWLSLFLSYMLKQKIFKNDKH
ncbi:MAG: hypothetical protein PVG20_00165 [Thioalkalispiraceae bacterium]|jgi:hypothetical protein